MSGAHEIVGLLHTVSSLASTFDDLIGDLGDPAQPAPDRVHIVDAGLLATAVSHGVTPQVHATVITHIRHLQALGARAVLVTCSSIAEAAEGAGAQVEIPVLRVDAAMCERAVTLATAPGACGRVAVLATLESTLGPTGRLLQRAASAAGGEVAIHAQVVEAAAQARGEGDLARHDALVTQAVERAGADADVVVLAQASMAPAAKLSRLAVPVLSSPASGAQHLVRVVGEASTVHPRS